ncbi:MAG: hypothetical protein EOO73_31980 [Myxococcales bacterium]|nr:MAG: hypothetical protein EOO73_31980 [Myxococcales bacterium]
MRSYQLAVLLVIAAAFAAPVAEAATSGDNGSHDPSRMIQSEGKLYIYSTGGGAKVSTNGLVWDDVASPPWNRSLPNNQGIWAPDGIRVGSKYFLFGSMWNDSKASRIVLLSTPSLDPAKAKWTDGGTVVEGPAGVKHSVIDAAPVLDDDGKLYIVWGGGYPFPNEADSIYLTRLSPETGLPIADEPDYDPPASPGSALKQGHKEGPYIYQHESAYFLFYQTGGCCSGASSTYTIHVARATDIRGPYTGDRTFYASKGSIHGPGHVGIYDACGYSRFTYHYYPDQGGSVIGLNELSWGNDGWPVLGPESTTPIVPCAAGDGPSGAAGSGTIGGSGSGGGGGGGGTMSAGGIGGTPTTGGVAGAGGTTASGAGSGGGGQPTTGGAAEPQTGGASSGMPSAGSGALSAGGGDVGSTPTESNGSCSFAPAVSRSESAGSALAAFAALATILLSRRRRGATQRHLV